MMNHVPWSARPWRRVAVYGLGISGRAALHLLRRHDVQVVAFDDRPAAAIALEEISEDPGIELRVGADVDRLDDLETLDGVVTSPGVPPERPLLAAARQRGLPIIAEVELAFSLLDGEVVGITGSNGKSTTTALAGAMLEAAGRQVEVCGNIGEALSSRVEIDGSPAATGRDATVGERVFVVELSSFQLEAVDHFRPESAALLNISPDHLDRHHDLDSYLSVKAAIFARQCRDDLAVLNADDARVAGLDVAAHRRFFSSQQKVADGCYLEGERVLEVSPTSAPRPLFVRSDVPLPGPHNLENAMAAALLARAHGAEPDHIVAGMRDFRGLPHRLERVRVRHGVTWYDDSKGTNIAATARSLEGFDDGTVVIILGGRFKGGDLAQLRSLLSRKARRIYLIGEAAPVFAEALSPDVEFEHTGTLEQAVERAASEAQPGEVVLLSPACSSFDQFDNFAQRGRVFQRLVKGLEGGERGAQASL
ncbi:MAG: UDP-N-acetylmuramoyl-L-alanine--D-glutamate ligase [Acidobacteriota bacterium]